VFGAELSVGWQGAGKRASYCCGSSMSVSLLESAGGR
jgi:hypothetical protein